MKIVVVGGVALGASFATRMRRLDEEAQIVIFEKSSYVSYANCGLPYNLSETIARDRLLLSNPEKFKHDFNIDVNVNHEVISIDIKNKYVEVKNLKTNSVFKEEFDKLILGPGTRSNALKIEGMQNEKNVFPLKNVDDLDIVKKAMSEIKGKNVVVYGAGFIGLEAAEQLKEKGYNVSVIEFKNSILKLDKDFSTYAEKELTSNGVNLYLNARTEKIDYQNKKIILSDGQAIDYDFIISAAGVVPNTEFIKNAGIDVDDRGIVITNEHMQTSDKNIYAGGDIVYSTHIVTGKKVYSPLAWGANRQAKVIANHIFGIKDRQPETSQTAIIKIFRETVAQTGLTEEEAIAEKINYDIALISSNHHAGYYPGARKVNMKLVYDAKTYKILGAQAIGESADKKIDIIATAIKGKLDLFELQDLNLSYSPPYGSAKDVVNVLASIAINKIAREIKTVKSSALVGKEPSEKIIDVRPETVFEIGTIKNATNIPVELLRSSNALPKDKSETIYLLCNTGHESYNAWSILNNLGYKNLINIEGGYNFYKAQLLNTPEKNKVDERKVTEMKVEDKVKKQTIKEEIIVDCSGLSCPGPLLKLYQTLAEGQDGDIYKVIATDFGFKEDVETWVAKNGHTLLSATLENNRVEALVMKGRDVINDDTKALAGLMTKDKEHATIVLFSGDYDKTIAALIIAQAAASIGKKVSIFATFWGLNALRIKPKKRVKKKFMKKMFGKMMPRGVEKQGLSKMNMGGMGKMIIKSTMKKHNVKTPAEMIVDAKALGIEFIACTMSMELLGIQETELIPGTTFAGVAKYISNADDSNVTLFI